MAVTVRTLVEYFGYRQLTGDNDSLDREIKDNNVNRPGLELSGYLEEYVSRRVVIIGEKETNYIKTMSQEKQRIVFDYLTNERIPMILISRDLPCPDILREAAIKKNFPIFQSFAPTSSLIVEIVSFLEDYFVTVESIHGVLMQINGKGVLITGSSGIGKSEIALELIQRGHILIADDRVDVYRLHNTIKGKAPEVLRNMLEIRGVGIIDVAMMYGARATMGKCQIDFVVDLHKWDENEEFDRLGDNGDIKSLELFGISVPKLTIPVSEGRSIAAVLEAAVTNFILKSKGYDSGIVFDNRIVDLINKNKEEA